MAILNHSIITSMFVSMTATKAPKRMHHHALGVSATVKTADKSPRGLLSASFAASRFQHQKVFGHWLDELRQSLGGIVRIQLRE